MLILASKSPRRQELLQRITANFEVVTRDTEESIPPGTPPDKAVRLLAERKAGAVSRERPDDIVIGADTVVVLDGEILGKPRDERDAARMLHALSGRTHTVYTGVAAAAGERCKAFCERADVTFADLDGDDIRAYIQTGEPMDKAGAYGIQGRGALFVSGIHGDFYTVMGLPVCRLAGFLRQTHGICWHL